MRGNRLDQNRDLSSGASDRALAKLASCEERLRDKLEEGLCRLPGYLRYRNAAILELLGRITAIIHDQRLECLVAGGLAYDAMRGKLTRVHHDLDLMCLAANRPGIVASLEAAGFRLEDKSPYHAVAHAEHDLEVDLFSWVDTAQDAMENIVGGILVRMPRAFYAARQTAYLYGMRLTLPGNDYLKSIRPFVECAEDRRFLAELATNPLVACDSRREVVVRRITLAVHEFTVSPEP